MTADHPNAKLIDTFYQAFARRDAAGMAACYAPDVVFSDPVFPRLEGLRARAMWSMLCERGADLVIEPSAILADDTKGTAHWDAHYTFSGTGRKVLNRIDAEFTFANGKIATHNDHFDLWRWTRMALGPVGTLLGWTPMVQAKVRRQAASALDAFLAKRTGKS